MNGFALILALAVGAQPAELAVRIRTAEPGGVTGYGSGTILASNDRGEELVLTARHVMRDAKWAWIQWKGKEYPARMAHESTRADLAAVTVDLPGTFADVPISRTPGQEATISGYGQSGGLHQHAMRFIASRNGWHEYSPGGNEGDSGAGVFDSSGQLFGVFVAKDTRNQNAVVVSSHELCQFIGPQNSASGSKRVVIFPFFWKRVTWGGGSAGSCPPSQTPSQSGVVITAPGVGVHVGTPAPAVPPGTQSDPSVATQLGPQGPPGPQGPRGTDAPPVDVRAIVSQIIAEIKADPSLAGKPGAPGPQGPTGPTGPPGASPDLSKMGITFVTPNLDGTTSSQFVPLGGTIGLKIPQPSSAPLPPTPGK